MFKKEVLVILGIIAFLLGITFAVYRLSGVSTGVTPAVVKASKLDKKAFIYFHGLTCPHCKELNKFLEEKGLTPEKLKYQKLEVFYNEENSALMNEAAKVCGIESSNVGVPFVYDNGKCVMGTPDAEALFLEKAKALKK